MNNFITSLVHSAPPVKTLAAFEDERVLPRGLQRFREKLSPVPLISLLWREHDTNRWDCEEVLISHSGLWNSFEALEDRKNYQQYKQCRQFKAWSRLRVISAGKEDQRQLFETYQRLQHCAYMSHLFMKLMCWRMPADLNLTLVHDCFLFSNSCNDLYKMLKPTLMNSKALCQQFRGNTHDILTLTLKLILIFFKVSMSTFRGLLLQHMGGESPQWVCGPTVTPLIKLLLTHGWL